MKKNRIPENPEIIAEVSHAFSRSDNKNGIIGILSTPFRKIAESEWFFSLQTTVTAKSLIIILSGLAAAAFIAAAVLTYEHNTVYHELPEHIVSSGSVHSFDELKALNKPAERSEIILSSGEEPDLLDVPFYSQKDYPTGCELVSTSMLLAFYGVDISADKLISDGYITAKKVYLNRYGNACGPDPDMYFVGNPLDEKGYGCYSKTIISALEKILPEDKYSVIDLHNKSMETICKDYLDKGIPVLLWASINMKPTYISSINHWMIDEGNKYGTEFRWRSNEHCLVMTGYDSGYYYFNDPLDEKNGTKYRKWQVEKRYNELGKMAVAVKKK